MEYARSRSARYSGSYANPRQAPRHSGWVRFASMSEPKAVSLMSRKLVATSSPAARVSIPPWANFWAKDRARLPLPCLVVGAAFWTAVHPAVPAMVPSTSDHSRRIPARASDEL